MFFPTLKTTLKIAFTFAGTLIGAGFASGQELLQFFITYGSFGFCGIFFAGLLFSFMSWRLLSISYQFQLHTYTDFIYFLFPPKIAFFFEHTITCFLFTVLVIMFAASGDIANDLFFVSPNYGYLILSIFIILSALKGFHSITKINSYVTPFLASVIILISLNSLFYHHFSFDMIKNAALYSTQPAPSWLLACVLYVSYNLILSTAILVPLGSSIHNKNALKYGSFIGGITLMCLSFLIVSTLISHSPEILSLPIPMLNISCTQNQLHAFLYTFIFIIAMFTTSLSCLYGCANKLKSILPVSYPLSLLLIVLFSLCFTQIGFSQLIATVFPCFGYIGLLILLKLVFKTI